MKSFFFWNFIYFSAVGSVGGGMIFGSGNGVCVFVFFLSWATVWEASQL